MKNTYPELSIVIPCKNEGESIYNVITEIQQTLSPLSLTYEIIVVNNNSTDNTKEESMRAGTIVRVIDCTIPGYGAAILAGVQASSYQYICKLDGDGSYNPKDIITMLNTYVEKKDVDLIIGNRFAEKNPSNIDTMPFLNRIFGVPMLNFITNLLYPSPYYIDAHCGLRLFNKDIVQKLNLHQTQFSFANEMVCKVLRNKYSIAQIPITLRKDFRINTSSKIRVVRDGLDALWTICKLRFFK